eukprot:TRINITY_DN7659_c0_g1_i1.p1 TRINITY_DN7659_c0_g1~~TRINITY_DN7659_c0_g1_i1.p1  ORF type:complete len:316 (+),score=40.16 TRINITY_DN7659_c0_g1_i1:95-1042(+)
MSLKGIEIVMAKSDFRVGEVAKGSVIVACDGQVSHKGISVDVSGTVSMQLPPKGVGVFESVYKVVKPVTMLTHNLKIAPAGKLSEGRSVFPFEVPLKPIPKESNGAGLLLESYLGVFINVQYWVHVEIQRGGLSKNAKESIQLVVLNPLPVPPIPPSSQNLGFVLDPSTAEQWAEKAAKAKVDKASVKFAVKGQIDRTVCDITQPFTGSINVEHSSLPIRGIDLHLVRIESCQVPDSQQVAKEATFVQTTQLAFGDPCRDFTIPLYMQFPRLFTCPTQQALHFKVDFEVALVVLFEGHEDLYGLMKFPITLFRKE